MEEVIKVLLERHQIRKTVLQKQVFQEWLRKSLSLYGYELKVQNYSKIGRNLIVGDMQKSEILISAHYDTPPHSIIPLITFASGWPRFIIGQLIFTLPIIVAFLWVSASIGYLIGSSFINLGIFGITNGVAIIILL